MYGLLGRSLGIECPCSHERAIEIPSFLLETYRSESKAGAINNSGKGGAIPPIQEKVNKCITNGLIANAMPGMYRMHS